MIRDVVRKGAASVLLSACALLPLASCGPAQTSAPPEGGDVSICATLASQAQQAETVVIQISTLQFSIDEDDVTTSYECNNTLTGEGCAEQRREECTIVHRTQDARGVSTFELQMVVGSDGEAWIDSLRWLDATCDYEVLRIEDAPDRFSAEGGAIVFRFAPQQEGVTCEATLDVDLTAYNAQNLNEAPLRIRIRAES